MLPELKWNTTDEHSPFVNFLNSVSPISSGAMEVLDKHAYPVFIEKKKYLLKPGALANNFYFILRGVIHGFIKEEGRQITTWINEEGEIVSSIRTLGTNRPCEEYLQALEDCDLIALPIHITEEVFDAYPETNIVARRLWEHNYRGAEQRAYLGRIPSAEKKYRKFIESQPGLIGRVPLKYIASYLGMTMETLCRIRARQK